MMEKVSSASVDITEDNIEKLKQLFPEILTDGNKIDFEKLQLILGEEVDGEKERYSFNWPGKREAIIGAQQPSKGTLRPNLEKSKNFDTTENLYIEGDNLEVLKLLQKSYNNKIKVIYIDPPYNTGKDFVYKDNFRDGVNNYLEQTGQVDSEGNLLSTNSESNGRFHTDWLNMMYPRLKLARNLLTEDGVIFISIDDGEQANLKKMCDEIFGKQNHIATFIWKSKLGVVNTTGNISTNHEYIIAYAKNIVNISFNKIETESEGRTENLRQWGQADRRQDRPSMYYPITIDNITVYPKRTDGSDGRWRVSKDTSEKLKEEGKLFFKESNGEHQIYREFDPYTSVSPYSSLLDYSIGTTATGTNEIKALDMNKYFDYPKPTSLIKFLLLLIPGDDYIVMDFFAGSSTTAHATMKLNGQDAGKRRAIMIQLPETLEEDSVAFNDGFKNISSISQERIRRAGEKIILENSENYKSLDIGFKYLALDKSNIREWNTDFTSIENELDLFSDVFVDGRIELDIVYEIMLKNGLELTLPVDTFEVNGKKIYDIAFGHQFICLSDEIDTNVAKAIIEKHNEYGTEITSGVVFKDSGFNGNDSEKLNCIQLLKDAGFIEANLQTI